MEQVGGMLERVLTLQEQWESACPEAMAEAMHSVVAVPSDRHGMGAFAVSGLAPGSIATLYPVHALGIAEGGACGDNDTHYFSSQTGPSAYRLQLLHRSVPEGMWADANPERVHVPGWLAHLVNDSASVRGTQSAEVLAYYDLCEAETNCALVPLGPVAPLMALVTTRAVAPGEELLLCYGHSYWLEQLQLLSEATPPPENDDDAAATAEVEARCMAQGRRMAKLAAEVEARYESACQELSARLSP